MLEYTIVVLSVIIVSERVEIVLTMIVYRVTMQVEITIACTNWVYSWNIHKLQYILLREHTDLCILHVYVPL